MPFYEYECANCKVIFESFHGVSDQLSECTKCGEKTIKKIPSLIAGSKLNHVKEQVGNHVKRHIEETRELLLDSQNSPRKDYEP